VITIPETAEIYIEALEVRKGAQYIVNVFVCIRDWDIADLQDTPIITYHSHQTVYIALVRDLKCSEIQKDRQCLAPKDAACPKGIRHG
jgi:hypothetical protein